MARKTERFPLDIVRHAKEDKPQKKSFVPIGDNKLGLEVDWEHEEFRFFMYKKKRKEPFIESDWFSFYIDEVDMRKYLYKVVSDYFKQEGLGKELPLYTQIELNLPVGHLHYHVWANTLKKILTKEVIYN